MHNFPSEPSIRCSYQWQHQLTQLHLWLAQQIDPASTPAHAIPTLPDIFLDGNPGTAAEVQAVLQRTSVGKLSVPEQSWASPTAASGVSVTAALSEHNTLTGVHIDRTADFSSEPTQTLPTSAVPHRILALKHRWHYLVENPQKDPEAFAEIAGDTFSMNWGHGGVDGFEELRTWVRESAASVSAARHDITHFEWHTLGNNSYQAVFEFDWYGFSRNNKPMFAQSRHTWEIQDNPTETFPRLHHMQVAFITPFRTVDLNTDPT